jgi:hypothetical protein
MPTTKPVTDERGLAHCFVPFAGKRRADDGTLTVYGKITGPDVDSSGQRMDPAWLKTAVPEWFETGGNIREMHQLSAVGKAIELQADGDDYFVSARIVDPLAARKCEEGVYGGFSIGIKKPTLTFSDPAAPGGVFTGGKIIETSVVDRGDLPTAKLVVAKAATPDGPLIPNEDVVGKADKEPNEPHAFKPSEDDKTKCATCGATESKGMHSDPDIGKKVAEPDAAKISDDARDAAGAAGQAIDLGQDHPSYLIRNVADLKKAIQAFGRSNPEDRDKLKAFIVKRAKALGKPDLIPDGWQPDAKKAAGDSAGDPEQRHAGSVKDAFSAIAQLIIQEAEELGDGDDEQASLSALVDAIAALKWWLWTEADEGEPVGGVFNEPASDDSQIEMATLAAKADVGKAGARHSAADQKAIQAAHDATVKAGAVCTTDGEPTEDAPDAGKAATTETSPETPDVTKVSAQLAEAMATIKSMQATVEAQGARIAEMGELAAPSGVRRMAAAVNATKLARADALRAQIADMELRSQGASGSTALGYDAILRRLRDELQSTTATKE